MLPAVAAGFMFHPIPVRNSPGLFSVLLIVTSMISVVASKVVTSKLASPVHVTAPQAKDQVMLKSLPVPVIVAAELVRPAAKIIAAHAATTRVRFMTIVLPFPLVCEADL